MIGSSQIWTIIILGACAVCAIYAIVRSKKYRQESIGFVSKMSLILPLALCLAMGVSVAIANAKESAEYEEDETDSEEELKYSDMVEVVPIEITPLSIDEVHELMIEGEDFVDKTRLGAYENSFVGTIEASSYLNGNYKPENLLDYDVNTSWQDGVSDVGIDETIDFYFDTQLSFHYIAIRNGSWVSEEKYYQNARPSSIQVTGMKDDVTLSIPLEDVYGEWQIFELSGFNDIDHLTFTIKDVYPGTAFTDTVITDVEFFGGVFNDWEN